MRNVNYRLKFWIWILGYNLINNNTVSGENLSKDILTLSATVKLFATNKVSVVMWMYFVFYAILLWAEKQLCQDLKLLKRSHGMKYCENIFLEIFKKYFLITSVHSRWTYCLYKSVRLFTILSVSSSKYLTK